MPPTNSRRGLALGGITALTSVCVALAGCTNLIGLTGFSTESDGGAVGHVDANTVAETSGDAGTDVSCTDDDATCYACAPTTTTQFLNACTGATCVPFDDVGRLTLLLPDGALPPLPAPPADAGTE
jgi:hypothetical protein